MPDKNTPPEGEKEPTSEVETIAKSELEELRAKAKKAENIEGYQTRKLQEREKAVALAEERVAQTQKDRDRAEREAVKYDPDALAELDRKHIERDRIADLAKREAALKASQEEHEEALKKLRETDWEVVLFDIASEYSVDPVRLKGTNPSSKEQAEAIAKSLPKREGKPPMLSDSGRGIGAKDWRDLSADDKIRLGTK